MTKSVILIWLHEKTVFNILNNGKTGYAYTNIQN